ncbi:LysR family transcriptional regulator [Granulosicoccus sp. 3-233]|uniref:LysR family transcriptional regulator n=1 Tax=Granulosicoccus sp. 3-233 TaxID=3417969 RepID=UPI003D34131E
MAGSKVNDILVFLAVVEAGNFVAAGKAFGLSRSTAGKSITRLEDSYGVRLLNRTTRTLNLTEEGRKLYEHGQTIRSAIEAADASIKGEPGAPSGMLRIAAPDALGRKLFLPIVQQYLIKWPEVRIEMSFSDNMSRLVEDGFDLAIRVGMSTPDNGLVARTVLTEEPWLCAAPAYFQHRARPASVEQLDSHDLIQFSSGGERQGWSLTDEHDIPLSARGRVRLRMDSAEALREAALAEFGIVMLPRLLVEEDITAGRLERVLPQVRGEHIPILVLYPHKRLLEPRVRHFIDLMVEQLGQRRGTLGQQTTGERRKTISK